MRHTAWIILTIVLGVALWSYAQEAKQQPPVERYIIEIDELAPVIETVTCPPCRPTVPIFVWRYQIYAHDEAPFPALATPAESLEYSYTFTPPASADPIHSDPEWSIDNWTLEVFVDGVDLPGVYSFKCRVRDRSGNTSEEFTCGFMID